MPLKDAKFVKEFLGLKSEQRVYECARLGIIPSVRIGRSVRFDEDALRDWMRRGGTAKPNENEQLTSK
jgi:excisionase family DNA binding protein